MNSTDLPTVPRLQLQFESRPVWLVAIESTIYITLVTSAFLGNSIVLWILLRNSHLRTIPNYFVMSLALSDVLLPLFGSTPSVPIIVRGQMLISDGYCQFQGFISTWLACTSLVTLTAMAVNRYYRIVKPGRYRTMFTSKRTKLLLLAIWVFALLSPSFPFLAGKKYYFHPGKFFCYLKLTAKESAPFMVVFLGLPLVIITMCYLKVFKALRRHSNNMRGVNANNCCHDTPRLSVVEIRVTKTLFATVAAFWVCWIPIVIVDFIDIGLGEWSQPRQVYYMYSIFAISSSAANPIIYGFMNKTFKEEYRKLFGLKRRESTTRVIPSQRGLDTQQPALVSFAKIETQQP